MSDAPVIILLDEDQVAAALGISARKWQALRNEPWAPRAIVLSPRLTRWSVDELKSAVANMPRQAAVASEPAQLRRVRIERMKGNGAAQPVQGPTA